MTHESLQHKPPRDYLGFMPRHRQPLRAALAEGLARYQVRYGQVADYVGVHPSQVDGFGDVPGVTIAPDRNTPLNELRIGRVSA